MNYNQTPKEAALANKEFEQAHRKLVESAIVENSLQITLREFSHQITRESPPNAEAAYWRIRGAEEFVRLFRNLSERPELPKHEDATNLGLNRKS